MLRRTRSSLLISFLCIGAFVISCASPEERATETAVTATGEATAAFGVAMMESLEKLELSRADLNALAGAQKKTTGKQTTEFALPSGKSATCGVEECELRFQMPRPGGKGMKIQLNSDAKMVVTREVITQSLDAIARSNKSGKPELASKGFVCTAKSCRPNLEQTAPKE